MASATDSDRTLVFCIRQMPVLAESWAPLLDEAVHDERRCHEIGCR